METREVAGEKGMRGSAVLRHRPLKAQPLPRKEAGTNKDHFEQEDGGRGASETSIRCDVYARTPPQKSMPHPPYWRALETGAGSGGTSIRGDVHAQTPPPESDAPPPKEAVSGNGGGGMREEHARLCCARTLPPLGPCTSAQRRGHTKLRHWETGGAQDLKELKHSR